MTTIHSLPAMLAAARAARDAGRRIALVPTMGYLHQGHLSLVAKAREHGADIVVMSIFVNPTQFAPSEDLSTYPRDLPRDAALAESAGVDILFLPEAHEVYPDGADTRITPGALGTLLEGAVRPTHFQGVLTVVGKLFNITLPHVAVFGQKDFQQAFLIKRMVRDLNFDLDIIVAPIVREQDGLAMSSRNVYLSPSERLQARALSESLMLALERIAAGERSVSAITAAITGRISREPAATIDYVTVAATTTLQAIETLVDGSEAVIALAVRIGKTRLLDNVVVVA